jgi:hypothetical protein
VENLLGEHEQGRDLIALNSHAQNLGDGETELDIPALSFLAIAQVPSRYW